VLNPDAGMLSPQFHLKYDDTFETIQGVREKSHVNWRHKCYFVDDSKINSTPETTLEPDQDKVQEPSTPDTHNVDRTLETGPNEIFAPQEEDAPTARKRGSTRSSTGTCGHTTNSSINQTMETNSKNDTKYTKRGY
jgi:hypothetical protein